MKKPRNEEGDHFAIKWSGKGRKAECAPDPKYPAGVDIDAAVGAKEACITMLPYPAQEVGTHVVRCNHCDYVIAITAAGRPDDPRRVRVPCRGTLNLGVGVGIEMKPFVQ